jgi:type IV pilus assembly protein PilN
MRTSFNLATTPLENNRRFIAGSSALGVIALVAMVLLSLHVVHARRANREMRVNLENVREQIRVSLRQQEALRNQFKSPQSVEALKRSEFLNALIAERTFPWTKMFSDLEQILPAGVRVISISPQMDKDGKVKVALSVGAVDDEQENKFLTAISSSPVFSDVLPTEENHTQRAGQVDRVLLNLEAHYSTK